MNHRKEHSKWANKSLDEIIDQIENEETRVALKVIAVALEKQIKSIENAKLEKSS